MKFLSFVFALLCAGAAFAKADAGLFNHAVRESIKQEIKKDGEIYRKKVSRAPASVEKSYQKQEEMPDKIEKQHKQLGRPSW
jgi:RNA-splicing ligase RtcB